MVEDLIGEVMGTTHIILGTIFENCSERMKSPSSS